MQAKGPMSDIEEKIEESKRIGRKYKPSKRDKYFIVRDFIVCLAVCHNVTPSIEEGKKTYQASSPD
jgi:magnesium-transporting ATPase (P-type)